MSSTPDSPFASKLAQFPAFFGNPLFQRQMRKIINIRVGQVGVQIGNACSKPGQKAVLVSFTHWILLGESYIAEHGLGVSS